MTNINAKTSTSCPLSKQQQSSSSKTPIITSSSSSSSSKPDPNTQPHISRSAIKNCTFTHLTPSTKIERSSLHTTTITGHPSHPSQSPSTIERSSLDKSSVTACLVERSQLSSSTVSGGKIERSALSSAELSGNCEVERSAVRNSKVVASRLERCALSGCEVRSARLSRCAFTNMVLVNGTWERNKLVGGKREREEAVMMSVKEWEQKVRGGWEPDNLKGYLIQLEMPETEMPESEPPRYTLPGEGVKEKPVDEKRVESLTEGDESYSRATGMAELELELEAYNGPELDSPPPYRE